MGLSLGVAGGSALWYLSRGTGVVSLLLFTAVMLFGILGPLRVSSPRWPRFATDALHRDLSLLAVALLAIHIITSVLDSFAPLQLIDAVVPFTSQYRPLWLGLGAVALDLLVALVITSLLRRRLGYGSWRAIHWLAYASWPVAVLHGLGTGTDVKQWWMLGLTAVCVAGVTLALLMRIGRSEAASSRRTWSTAGALASVSGIAVFTLAGPLQQGWARRAGTPSKLLPRRTATAFTARPARSVRTAATLSVPFSATVSGTVTQHPVGGGTLLDLNLRLHGGAQGRLRIRLAGAPLDGGGLSLTGSQVDLAADGLPTVMDGKIVTLQGDTMTARVAGATGQALDLRARLVIPTQGASVSGTLSASGSSG